MLVLERGFVPAARIDGWSAYYPSIITYVSIAVEFNLFNVLSFDHQVGINFLESSSCSLKDSGNAAIPAMMPAIIRMRDIIDQITPQH